MLNETIRVLRTAHNWTQVDLAKKMNVSKQSISNWENDNIQPSIEILLKLSEVFSVSTDYLLGRDNRQMLDVSGLTDEQIAHVRQIVNDLRQGGRGRAQG
ncbi:MAG: helix-turn-helix transcriptional regulator [Eubacteriales bacterium]